MGKRPGYVWKGEGYQNWLRTVRQRRRDFLADKVCDTCGIADGLRVKWVVPPGSIRPSAIWHCREELRVEYLKLVRVQCVTCRNRQSAPGQRVEHGGGTQGVAGCRCDLCRARRASYMRQWRKNRKVREELRAELPRRPRGTVGQ